MSDSLVLVPFLELSYVGLPCLTSMRFFCFILFYFVMFGCHLLEACYSLMRDRKEVDLHRREGGEELEGTEVQETIIMIYGMGK